MVGDPFGNYDNRDVADLIAAYPLAWVCARPVDIGAARLLPLLGEYADDGSLVALIGHMAVSGALHDALAAAPQALILFTGPHGYISPNVAGSRNWGPTWNYAEIRVEADVVFDAGQNDAALSALVAHVEADYAEPWQASELGERYPLLSSRIIAFRASVTRMEARFKLGQDESPAILASIVDGVAERDLADWMKRLNRNRL